MRSLFESQRPVDRYRSCPYERPRWQGDGQKTTDFSAIPLCAAHHRENLESYHLLGEQVFLHRHGIDLNDLVLALQSRFWQDVSASANRVARLKTYCGLARFSHEYLNKSFFESQKGSSKEFQPYQWDVGDVANTAAGIAGGIQLQGGLGIPCRWGLRSVADRIRGSIGEAARTADAATIVHIEISSGRWIRRKMEITAGGGYISSLEAKGTGRWGRIQSIQTLIEVTPIGSWT